MTLAWLVAPSSVTIVSPRPTRIIGQPCSYCRRKMVLGRFVVSGAQHPALLRTRQHIIPRRMNGPTCPENIRRCCAECNQSLASVSDCPGALATLRAVMPELANWICRVRWLQRATNAMAAGLPIPTPRERDLPKAKRTLAAR